MDITRFAMKLFIYWNGVQLFCNQISFYMTVWKLYEEFYRKTGYINFCQYLRYLRLKLLKYKYNNKKMYDIFDHNFKNINLFIMSYVSFERQYFVLYDGALILKRKKMALKGIG